MPLTQYKQAVFIGLVVAALVWACFVTIRVGMSYQSQQQAAACLAATEQLLQKQINDRKITDQAIDQLWVELTGKATPPTRTVIQTEAWSQNRDRAVRDSISTLQRRLYRVEAELERFRRDIRD